MEICVSVYTNETHNDHAQLFRAFTTRNSKVVSIYEPRNLDYSRVARTHVTFQLRLHKQSAWGAVGKSTTPTWHVPDAPALPDGWAYEHGPDVFIHSYDLPIDEPLVHKLCDAFGPVSCIEYLHTPSGQYHAKVTMACATMAFAVVQMQNGCIYHEKCLFVNFNRYPFP